MQTLYVKLDNCVLRFPFNWLFSRSHNTSCFTPQKIYISTVFNFSWDLRESQERLKQFLCKILWGLTRCIMATVKIANTCYFWHSCILYYSLFTKRSIDVDRLVSSCKLPRKSFSLWVINASLYGNTNFATYGFMACLSKTVNTQKERYGLFRIQKH